MIQTMPLRRSVAHELSSIDLLWREPIVGANPHCPLCHGYGEIEQSDCWDGGYEGAELCHACFPAKRGFHFEEDFDGPLNSPAF